VDPFERRLARVLCDHLGLCHGLQASAGDGELFFLRVWKPSASPGPAPSFEELRRWDLRLSEQAGGRLQSPRLAGPPLFWPYVSERLLQLEAPQLGAVVHKVLADMRGLPCAAWGLLWVQLLVQRGLPLPAGSLRALLRAADSTNDVYALLEVLLLAQKEPLRARAALYQKRRALQPEDEDRLDPADWSRACVAVLRNQGGADLPAEAFHQAFTEVHYSPHYVLLSSPWSTLCLTIITIINSMSYYCSTLS